MKKPRIIGIIGGKGKMGTLFAEIFKKNGYKIIISDIRTKLTNKEVAKKADVVIISVPIDKTIKIINEIAPHTKKSALLMDLTSIKQDPVKTMLKAKSAVIGFHPMFNHTSYGPNQKAIICPIRAKNWLPWLKDFLHKNQLIFYEMSPKKHDQIMTLVQGLVHFAEISFAKTLQKTGTRLEKLLPYASPASALKIEMVARILAQDPNLYGNIQIQNPENLKILQEYLKTTNELYEIVKSKDLKKFEEYFSKSAKFLGRYKEKALFESDWIIAQLIEKNKRKMQAGELYIESQSTEKIQKANIGILGPKLTFSDFAADKWIKKNKKEKDTRNYYKTIPEIFNALNNNEIRIGIVPIESTTDGTIRDTLDGLFNNNIKIIQEISLPIHHCLAVLPNTKKKDISAIMSKSQALSACSKYIKKHFKSAEIINSLSTVAAMEEIEKHIAVIGPKKAAEALGLRILDEKIEDNKNNKTTFVVITKKNTRISAPKAPKKKTSIAFYFGKNKPGLLFGVYREFANANINLTRIESRPSRKEFGDYIFYLDFEGDGQNPKASKALNNIKKKVKKLRIFGNYPF